MPTEKQLAANRSNAQFSTGPRTSDGQARSSQNSLRHGIFADDLALLDDPESAQELHDRLTEYLDHYQPVNPLERDTIEEIVRLKIRIRRVSRAEVGLLNDARYKLMESDVFHDTDGTLFARYDTAMAGPGRERAVATMHLGAAWHSVSQSIDRMSRYETRFSNLLDKAMRRLDTLIASRPAPQPAPAPDPEPAPPPPPKPPAREAAPPADPQPTCKNEPNFDLTPIPATPAPAGPAIPAVTRKEDQ